MTTTLYIVLAIVLVGILATVFISYYYYKIRTQKFVQNFLDSQSGMVIMMNSKTTLLLNRAALRFFGYNSLKSFLTSHSDVSDFFLEGEDVLTKHSYGKGWLKSLSKENKKQLKVKLRSREDSLEYHFHIRVSNLIGSNDYVVAFEDITKIEREKTAFKKSADYDALTKIYNRVKINELFGYIFFNAKKYNQHLSIILFDIDHFKRINDTYGHNTGDSVLKELSGLIRGMLREGDIFARWGGEEFLVVLNNSTVEQASMLAERLRKAIEQYHFNNVGQVTCSFGVTELEQGDTETLLLERVDKVLYEAKDNGRNQVVKK